MDRLTQIEDSIIRALQEIDPANATSVYTPHTNTGQVQIQDLVLAESRNEDEGATPVDAHLLINHVIEIDSSGEQSEGFELSQNHYSNVLPIVIRSAITVDDSQPNPVREAQIRGNQLVSDLKWAFGVNNSLYKTAQFIEYVGWNRTYTDNNDLGQPLELQSYWRVYYNQELLNPDSRECV